jgi:hypothetical protein
VDAAGNVSGANINTTGLFNGKDLNLTGNATVAGFTTVTGNVTGGNIVTSNTVQASNLVLGNNASVFGNVGVAGNVTGANLVTTGTTFSNNLVMTGTANIAGNANVTGSLSSATLRVTGVANVGGVANVVGNIIGGANAIIAGYANIGGNIIGGGNLTLPDDIYANNAYLRSFVYANANVSAGNVISNAKITGQDLLINNDGQVTGNLIVNQDLVINGNLAYVNVTSLAVEDPIIGLGRGANNTPLTNNDGKDRGTSMYYFSATEKTSFMGYDNSAVRMIAAQSVSIANEVVSISDWGDFQTGNIYGNSLTLSGNGVISAASMAMSGNVSANNLTVSNIARVDILGVGMAPAAGNVTGDVYVLNQVFAYGTSDLAFKENVMPITNAVNIVANIGGHTFDWSENYVDSHGGEDGFFIVKHDFGVIAQDVQKAFPLAVRTREDGTLAVDYQKLSALAMAAIKELNEKVDTQASVIEDLLARVTKLESL